jgi:hypothetical protein
MAIRDDFTAGEVLAAADLNDTFGAKLNLAGGKVLQVVRATDATNRTTTSSTFVDATISVTITPQKNTSAILLLWNLNLFAQGDNSCYLQITDSSNNAISGSQEARYQSGASGGLITSAAEFAYATPATTSAITFKGRFRASGGTVGLNNSDKTGQLYAIEVSA